MLQKNSKKKKKNIKSCFIVVVKYKSAESLISEDNK